MLLVRYRISSFRDHRISDTLDPHTLTFYSLAAGLCFSLSIVLLGYAHLQRGTLLIRATAQTMLILAVAFFFSGYGPLLPRWVTVVGTNTLLLAAAVAFLSGVNAYAQNARPRVDRAGLAVVLLALPMFAWWGLVEPDGVMRSIVISIGIAILSGRIAWVLIGIVRQGPGSTPARMLALLFVIACLWMVGRSIALMLSAPIPVEQRGANPTTWLSVFWANVLFAGITASVMAMEMHRHKARLVVEASTQHGNGLESTRSNLLLLWTLVIVIVLTILAEAGIAYSVLYQREYKRLQERSQLVTQSFVEHTEQVIGQVDLMLRTARGLIERHTSPADLETFIRSLDIPHEIIGDIFVIDADGAIVVPQAERARGRFAMERNYFLFHRERPRDELFISPVSLGQVTGKYQFRLSRRVFRADGSFAGVILVPIEPKAFTSLYRRMLVTDDAVATLISTEDRKIRARAPHATAPESYNVALNDTPLWESLEKSPQGSYRNSSPVDGVERFYSYQRIGDLPLVMISGFSLADVRKNTLQSIQPIGLGALLALAVVIALAAILTGVIRRRDEQANFISMLAHELKTPLSVIRMTLNTSALASTGEARIERAVREMHDVIERCLQADRLESGMLNAHFARVDLNALLRNIRDETGAPERIVLEVEPLSPCNTDAQLLHTILTNLVDNALKYGKSGESIRLDAYPEKRKGHSGVTFTVTNVPGAAGFPDSRQLFRKYYRAPAAHAKTGSGLGLHLAEGLAHMLGGELRYAPENDTVKFQLWIPL